jgi:type II secretory pathway pseudopilin PulG
VIWRRIFAERRSILVPLLALLIIDGVLLGAVVFPLRNSVAAAEDDAAVTQEILAQANQRKRMMQNARASRDRAEKELATFYGSILPSTQAAASRVLLVEVARLARENNLRLGGRAWEEEKVKDTNLRSLTAKVDLTGDYGAILRSSTTSKRRSRFLVISLDFSFAGDAPGRRRERRAAAVGGNAHVLQGGAVKRPLWSREGSAARRDGAAADRHRVVGIPAVLSG